MAPSRRAAAASNATTKVKKLASSSKPSTKAKAKVRGKRSQNRKDLSRSSARAQAAKHAAGNVAGGSNSQNNVRKSNSQRTAGVAAKNTPRRAAAAKPGNQVQSQRNSGKKPKDAPLKPTRRFNAEAAGNKKATQNSKKTKSTIKAGRQAATAKQTQSSRKVRAQSKENGLAKTSSRGKAKKEVVSGRKSVVKATTPRGGRKRKAPEEDPAIIGDENVEMLATDTRVEPVRLPLELKKDKVGQGEVPSKAWLLRKFLANQPAREASLTQETDCRQEATAEGLTSSGMQGPEVGLGDDSSSESSDDPSSSGGLEDTSTSSSSAGLLAEKKAVVRQFLEAYQKQHIALQEFYEKEFEFREQNLKLQEEAAEMMFSFVKKLAKQ